MWTTKTDQTGQMPRLIGVFAGNSLILLVLSRHGSDADPLANSVDSDQTAPLIWVCTVCSDLSVLILRTFMVRFSWLKL